MGSNNQGYTGGGGWLSRLGMMLMGAGIAAASVAAYSGWQTGDRIWTALGNAVNNTQPPAKVDVRSVVIQQMRDASELTTAIFAMQAVVPTSREMTVGGFVVGTTKLLYIAYGEVRAGVDLSKLSPENIQVTGDRIHIQLPPPQILSSKIDVNRSSVYDYDRGFLGLGPDVAPELQTAAQQKALKSIEVAACNNGLFNNASDRARQVVTQFLSTAGYKEVIVDPPVSKGQPCPSS